MCLFNEWQIGINYLKASVYTKKNQVTSGILTVYHEKALREYVHASPIGTVVPLYGFLLKASLRHVRRIHVQELAVITSQNGRYQSNTYEDTSSSTNAGKSTGERQ